MLVDKSACHLVFEWQTQAACKVRVGACVLSLYAEFSLLRLVLPDLLPGRKKRIGCVFV